MLTLPLRSAGNLKNTLMKTTKTLLIASIAGLLLPSPASSQNSVTWQSVWAPAQSSDVVTNGSTVLAAYWSGVEGTNMINGVPFIDSGAYSAAQNGVTATVGGAVYGLASKTFYRGTTLGHGPFSVGAGPDGAYYAALLGDGAWGGSPMTLSLSGLVVAHQYLVQFWAFDDRYTNANYIETISGSTKDNNMPTLTRDNATISTNNLAGTYNAVGGQWVVGTFTANVSTQSFTLTAGATGGAQLNGFQLRDITGLRVPVCGWKVPALAQGTGATVGQAFSYQIPCFYNATNYGASNLPPGLSLNASTGVISGTPSDAGIYYSTISGTCSGISYAATIIFVMALPEGTPLLSGSVPRGYFNNVAEATNYTLVYSLNAPWVCSYNSARPGYAVDTHTNVSAFSRVAYYVELQAPGGPLQYVWASMNAFTTNPAQIGVPTSDSGANFNQSVTNLTVVSDVSGVAAGSGLSGSIAFTSASNGTMLISNIGAVLTFTNWNGNGGYASLGIGTNLVAITNYEVRSIQVLALNSATNMTIQPVADPTLLKNPGKGYVEYWGPSEYTAAVVDTGYSRCSWAVLEPAEGGYDWSWIDSKIASYAAQGVKFSFRVINTDCGYQATPLWVYLPGTNAQTGAVYTNGSSSRTIADPCGGSNNLVIPVSWDNPVYVARMKEFIQAFAARYNGNTNIEFIDLGEYGLWGESNGSFGAGTSNLQPNDLLTNYYEPYVQAFPNTKLLEVEGTFYGPVGATLINQGCGDRTDGGMYGVGNDNSTLLFSYPYQPTMMEGAQYGPASTNYYRFSAMNEYLLNFAANRPSFTQFNYNSDPDFGADDLYLTATNFFNTVANLLGYHFVLQQASVPKVIQADVPFSLSWTWLNDGLAPIYQPCHVALALVGANGNLVQQQWLPTSNPQAWMSGLSTTESFTNITFSSVSVGCQLAVGLFVNQTDSNPTYKLGIKGRTTTGWYILNSVQANGSVPAGSVIWQNSQSLAGVADVATNGATVLATYFDIHNPGLHNVNGVSFTNNGTLITTGNGVTAQLTGNWNVFEGTANGQTGNYGTILNGDAWGSATQTLALSGLTVGGQYLVQFWEVDGRGTTGKHTPISATASDVNSQTLTYYTATNAGAYVTGSFTAGAATEMFTLSYVTTEIDTAAFQLRNVTAISPVATNPTNITATISGNILSLSWPADHAGWRLLVQTNHVAGGLSANTNDWGTVSGSPATNHVGVTIERTNPAEFYRLVYP